MQLFYHSPIPEDSFLLEKEEAHHLIKVLRKATGDEVFFTDGEGYLYTCQIQELSLKKTVIRVLDKQYKNSPDYHIHLAIAATKNADRMEWLIEKAVEIGLNEITLIKTTNSERNFLKTERLEKKAISALKQSLTFHKTIIHPEKSLEAMLKDPHLADAEKFIAYVDEGLPHHLFELAPKGKKYVVLIGPEGDFTPEEIALAIANDFKPCSLGTSRLRTETAGLVAVHTLNLKNTSI